MKSRYALVLIFIGSLVSIGISQEKHNPSFEEVISLRSISNPQMSPDGQHVVYQSRSVDWENNRYDTELFISKNRDEPFQLTYNPEGSSTRPQWSPDGNWISFLSNRGDKTQLYVMHVGGGEALPITKSKFGISQFEWSPDGSQIAYIRSKDDEKKNKKREDKYGAYSVEDEEFTHNEIWLLDFDPTSLGRHVIPEDSQDSLQELRYNGEPLLDSTSLTITDLQWSPDGKFLAVTHQPDPLINSFFNADISLIDVHQKSLRPLVSNNSFDGMIDWSPDGSQIIFSTSLDDSTSNYYKNSKLFRIDLDGSNQVQLAANFDENIRGIEWNNQGIYGVAWSKTDRHLIRIDPVTGAHSSNAFQDKRVWSISFDKSGQQMAMIASGNDDLAELYITDGNLSKTEKLTDISGQISNWLTAQGEMVEWKSKDGATIEGALLKPQDFDPNKKYPLMVIIHGGPTGISYPLPAPSYVYPIVQWLNKGALVLQPNYRGSAGYGEAFRSLNVKNLGVGDAWDVISGIESLEKQGFIDSDRISAMGWSQGGYISAFLTTNYDKFKAISVGAGISNWMTYYVNTDIHPFTRQYLKDTPWSNKEIYEKTSPMTNINKASTPTLIQHGEFDRRVPIANAYELFQGLQDVGVETKLIVYKGFGHGINKPKERLAAVWHNWQWFGKHIWDQEIELPD